MVLVVTGGEPSLQDNLSGFLRVAEDVFKYTQIESNGILVQENMPISTTLVVSPKCIEKNGIAIKYIKPNPAMLERADCLKFVVEADPESPYHDIPNWAEKWHKETGLPVYVSPMNVYNDVPKASKKLRATTNRTSLEQRSSIDEVVSFWETGLLSMGENQKNHEYAAKLCMQKGYKLQLQIHLYASLA
jgi:organic radical activating enzyme